MFGNRRCTPAPCAGRDPVLTSGHLSYKAAIQLVRVAAGLQVGVNDLNAFLQIGHFLRLGPPAPRSPQPGRCCSPEPVAMSA